MELDRDEMKYVVLHNNPEGLVMNQQQRDLLFSTGNVVDVQECSLFSLQTEFFKRVTRRPLTIVLWGMADRYGVAEQTGVEVLEAKTWSDAHNYCQGLRPRQEDWTDDEGKPHTWTVWEKPGQERIFPGKVAAEG